MQFDSFQALLMMEGHGPYVWTCYAVFFVLMTALVVWSVRQRKALVRQQVRQEALRQRQAAVTDPVKPGGGDFSPINQSRT
ncbi:MAG: heme exporter protein CcmD [Marinobacter sp.]|uniref:heme exporter protein CcmD n=1 Tax=Marinobacter sp. TaxID=50741 RepID=UPI00299EDECE|nr:heme exporter protein CcmD [Marinobacter sp.]MDX1635840.1 heme exporter protein CcmD [Marinobacter sp.]